MKNGLLAVIFLVVGVLAGLWLQPRLKSNGGESGSPMADAPAEREILYWVAPMDPNFRRPGPGKSPMGMDLVPVYADEMGGETVTISPSVAHNLGVRTARVESGPLWRRIRTTGRIGYDESRWTHVHTRTAGWIQRLGVDAAGDPVAEGQVLFTLYAPEVVNAELEFLQARQRGDRGMRAAAEEKLRALGVTGAEIERLAERGRADETIDVVAEHDGVVASLNVREGMYVMPATEVLGVADVTTVWLEADVFAPRSAWVALDQPVEARFDHWPGDVFEGRVDYLYPTLDPVDRSLRVRVVLDNADGRLKPGMVGEVTVFGGRLDDVLSVPREAVIRSGQRDRIVVALEDGEYRVHEVETGIESGEWVEIRSGLAAGDRVVVSGQFLIDSEASVSGSVLRLQPPGGHSMSGHDHD